MEINVSGATAQNGTNVLARVGLIAKGFVYIVLGALAFMAAFEVGGQSSKDTDRSGVFNFLNDSFAGKWLLPVLALGLLCYSLWRFTESAKYRKNLSENWKKVARYLLSGLVYLLAAFSAFKVWRNTSKSNGDSQQQMASELLSRPFGQWLVGIAAVILAAVGCYQVYYGLSEKYKEHVQKMTAHDRASSLMLRAGKVGYVARGVVWLIVSFLMFQASFASQASKAGDTSRAFEFVEDSPMGSYLLGALGIGLAAYGFFNFVRARYERFD
jgi:hypothetical protein